MNAKKLRTIRLLLGLYRMCLKGEKEYRKAFGEIEDSDLKYLFSSYSLQKARFSRQLRDALTSLGCPPSLERRTALPVQKGSGRSIGFILVDRARGEKSALKQYREALASDLSEQVRELVHRQSREVEAMGERIHELYSLAEAK